MNLWNDDFTMYSWEFKCNAKFRRKEDAQDYAALKGLDFSQVTEHYYGPFKVFYYPSIDVNKPDHSPDFSKATIYSNTYGKALIRKDGIEFECGGHWLDIASWKPYDFIFQTYKKTYMCKALKSANGGSSGSKHYKHPYGPFEEVELNLPPLEYPVLIG